MPNKEEFIKERLEEFAHRFSDYVVPMDLKEILIVLKYSLSEAWDSGYKEGYKKMRERCLRLTN